MDRGPRYKDRGPRKGMVGMRTLINVVLGIMILGLGFWAGLGWADPAPVPAVVTCPAEDSCQVDYRDGAWWLRTYDDHSGEVPGPWVRVSR